MSRYKSTKKRSKLERLLRQDHSDVYFDNDKLNDQLLIRIDELKREKYRHDLEHETEIFELRKEYRKLILLKNEDDDEDEEEDIYKLSRPHTVTGMNLSGTVRIVILMVYFQLEIINQNMYINE